MAKRVRAEYAGNPLRPEDIRSPVPADIDIAMEHMGRAMPIAEVCSRLGLEESEVTPYGKYKAKISLDVLNRAKDQPNGKYVVVSGINPTPLGEGKSTTTLGLAQAIGAHMNMTCFANVRQPSQGPTFGIKGGAAGGGYSQAIPMEEFNLHGTGDIHAITAANNLLAAAIDARMFHEKTQPDEALYRRLTTGADGRNFAPPMLRRLQRLGITETDPDKLSPEDRKRFARLDIDPETVTWRRVTDVNDRFLRVVEVGKGAQEKGQTRETGFDIAVASEVMAILALCKNLHDYNKRLREIVIGYSRAGEPVTADDIGCAGAMMALLRDTIQPTLLQTLEGTPVFMHAGPFGNIAHGNSSIVADEVALKLAGPEGFVLTEAGFGADMGGEKFVNIKCRASGLQPDAAVIVATCRALKFHAGKSPAEAKAEDLDALRQGYANLGRHIENFSKWNVPTVVVLNRFVTDTDAEIRLVQDLAAAASAQCVVSEHWAKGGRGALDAARAVVGAAASKRPGGLRFTYTDNLTLKEKIASLCTNVYGAGGVEYSEVAERKLAQFQSLGYSEFPICMAKTQYSFSHDPELKGAPSGFVVPIKDVRVSCGARFVFPLLGTISTMPGLPTRPAYYGIDVDCDTGIIQGLS
eukprot:Hpha_TRINITY_DN14941_c2_g17::TRINITY_DN14941_c2_g17_i1::g.143556::m.143556/K00288/MTHFD; methylenetetrahydrofolate dehydrogenase (NADP+) / methenyltetrahydrofolate cyclohydrolase / formyltetrahydrofolate synthetase